VVIGVDTGEFYPVAGENPVEGKNSPDK